ncbi:hypothetical protein MWMV17_MWMV17_00659 [Acinetobacter calcoaceticus]|uniref:PBP domain-containing protein n=1 Tax=Acinetobacter calcoaceticus DSM 30006 = CIP 81.8 TaxID=981331 RepID=A0ABN0K6C6_ACICA|nr:hypothetical protein [Acinetobacter calcoaceticus]ENV98983.1 hypothetical protein F936_02066 [Acinetobacter calcoaceticus DSM 30006 = CIP 81.8]CAI3111058.1 hypothetical protein MWMV17_MWMV17_00659 [Acinetobacter calcoaceticus]SUU55790.1 Uncharacterised protein [Acinetobacter calcoaceticus]
MKKLFLFAILLGLSGCGDNNQNETSESNMQMNLLQTTELAAPTLSNYNLTASARVMSSAAAPLGGWSITNSTVMGASTLIDTVKDTRVSAALVTPNAKQVAEVLRGGVAGIALSIAVDQLLGAVDWVMDAGNNQIRYKPKSIAGEPPITEIGIFIYRSNGVKETTRGDSINAVCKNIQQWYFEVSNFRPTIDWEHVSRSGSYFTCRFLETGYQRFTGTIEGGIYSSEKTLPLETLAGKVISNADSGSLDAQVATNGATQNILNDVVQAEPVVQELEKNADNKCPSGITNGNGDCWVCSRESWQPIRSRVVYAKDVTNGLGGCSAGMNSSQLLTRYNAYTELGASRDAENACWSPQDQEHLIQAKMAKATANDCKSYLGALGQ